MVNYSANLRKFLTALAVGFSLALVASSANAKESVQSRIVRYEQDARAQLLPFFQRAGVQFPPRQLALLIFKKNQRLDLWAKDDKHKNWMQIRSFSVLAASGSSGPKLKEGDHQVPEGLYHITHLNPNSQFDLSMALDYPNEFDRLRAKQDGRSQLGGDIFIHGGNRSVGCVAIGDMAIEQLFPLVKMVGVEHVQVIIAPNDYRLHTPEMASVHPQWIPLLYQSLDRVLNQFS
jgi:murein L,D-transpeptidase YafK